MTLPNNIAQWYQTEKAKLAPLPLHKRITYILRYYRWWFAGLAALLALALLIGSAAAQNRRQILLEGFFTNDEWDLFNAGRIEEEYGETLHMHRDQRIVFDDNLYIDLGGQASDYTAASNGKIIAYMATGELDFVVTTRPVLTHFEGQVPMQDLRSILPSDLLETLNGRFVTGTDADGNRIYEAVDMTGSRYVAGVGADRDPAVTDTYYLFVPYRAPHTEQVADFLRYCFADAASSAGE